MPLLAPHQDPQGLEARVAFHLYRLGLNGTALRRIGFSKTTAADLANARIALSRSVDTLAQDLGVDEHELTRPLTDDERTDWAFYRRSARSGQLAWKTAATRGREAGLSSYRVARVIGIDHRLVKRVLDGKASMVFTREMALALAEVLGGEPENLLPPERE